MVPSVATIVFRQVIALKSGDVVDEEVIRLLASGPSQVELQQVAANLRTGFLREIEKVVHGSEIDERVAQAVDVFLFEYEGRQ